jgi:hypothetical protein
MRGSPGFESTISRSPSLQTSKLDQADLQGAAGGDGEAAVGQDPPTGANVIKLFTAVSYAFS